MAPEFFPFLFILFLAGAILVFVLAAIFIEWPRRILGFLFAFALKHLRPILIIAILPMLIMLVATAYSIRQQFFLNEPMATAAAQGDIERVRALLDRGASPDSWGIDFVSTALMAAAEQGHGDIVELLLSKGADPSVRDDDCMSALQHARQHGYENIAALLIKAGAEE